jgi:hypothetical protein
VSKLLAKRVAELPEELVGFGTDDRLAELAELTQKLRLRLNLDFARGWPQRPDRQQQERAHRSPHPAVGCLGPQPRAGVRLVAFLLAHLAREGERHRPDLDPHCPAVDSWTGSRHAAHAG